MVDEKNSPPGPNDEALVDADAAATREIAPSDDAPDTPIKGRGGRGPMLALAIVALTALAIYLSWPTWRQLLLAQLPQPAPQAMAAVRALDHRMAQLETANAQYDNAIASIKDATADVSRQLDSLAKAMPGGEALSNLSQKLSALEESFDQLWQKVKADGAAALESGAKSVDDTGALKIFNSQLEAVKTRLAELAGNMPGSGDNSGDVAALTAENAQLRQTVSALQDRLTQLETSVRQSQKTQQAAKGGGAGDGLILAVGQLRQVVLAGQPYAASLAAVTALAGEDAALSPAIGTLTPFAKHGVATPRALSDQFSALTRAVLQADQKDGGGFLQRTWQRVSSLVTVRRVGEVEGGETDAVLARTERRLAAGELAAAVALMNGLDGPAAAAAGTWLDRAQARLAAEAALAAMQARIIARLADG